MFRTALRRLAVPSGLVSARVASSASSKSVLAMVAGGSVVAFTAYNTTSTVHAASAAKVNYDEVRQAIEDILDDETHDSGSFGPLFVRLAWHASGTFDKHSRTGGSGTGASMRFAPECDWGANAGLGKARARLAPLVDKYPGLTHADLWSLAGVVAVEAMGGPKIRWSPGRSDCTAKTAPKLPDGLLPDALQGPTHLRHVFYRMGFTDQDIVALSGAHALGQCHTTSSGFDGPWTNAPTTFSNLYFQELLNKTWVVREWKGPKQYQDKETRSLMMLVSDMALTTDPVFRKYAEIYAKDEQRFFQDFAKAFSKLLHLGL